MGSERLTLNFRSLNRIQTSGCFSQYSDYISRPEFGIIRSFYDSSQESVYLTSVVFISLLQYEIISNLQQ